MMHSRALGWILIPSTLLLLQVVGPNLPLGLSPLGLWGGITSVSALALLAFIPAQAFRRLPWVPVFILAQFATWAVIWQHITLTSVWAFLMWLVPFWVLCLVMLRLVRTYVVVTDINYFHHTFP
jgi:hypothetical protein